MSTPLVIEYYSDVLCVWAWIAQKRIQELEANFGKRIMLRHRFVDVFGHVPAKIQNQWSDRGGYEGFAAHVKESATDFAGLTVNADIWKRIRPSTSANAHLVLRAVALETPERLAEMSRVFRQAFFEDCADISNLDTLLEISDQQGVDVRQIKTTLNNGSAIAELMADYNQAKLHGIKGSPSYRLDDGRQVLFGNVGYRVLHANVEELLDRPQDIASWC